MSLLRKFFADESASTAVEHALVAACISLAVIGGANSIGLALKTKFTAIAKSLK